jgi:hypothetical protein
MYLDQMLQLLNEGPNRLVQNNNNMTESPNTMLVPVKTATQFSDAFAALLKAFSAFQSSPHYAEPWWPLDVTDTSGSFGRFVWVNSDEDGWGHCYWEDDDIA